MLGGADHTNGELPSYITGANNLTNDPLNGHLFQFHHPVCGGNG